MSITPKTPGDLAGRLSSRPLHFIWLADCSGSMQGAKIESLNRAIRESLPEMRRVADENPHADIKVRAIAFSSGARWHVGQPTDVDQFRWPDLRADGVTDLGHALKLLAKALEMPPMEERGMPPVLVLISDGMPTDDYKSGIKEVLERPWGRKAVRIAIGLGNDADDSVLQEFIGNNEIKPLRANTAPQLTNYIKWASTAVIKAASTPPVAADGTSSGTAGTVLPGPVNVPQASPGDEVW